MIDYHVLWLKRLRFDEHERYPLTNICPHVIVRYEKAIKHHGGQTNEILTRDPSSEYKRQCDQ